MKNPKKIKIVMEKLKMSEIHLKPFEEQLRDAIIDCELTRAEKRGKEIGIEEGIEKGKEIGRAELSYLSSVLDGNIDVINNEIEKLINYCKDRHVLLQLSCCLF